MTVIVTVTMEPFIQSVQGICEERLCNNLEIGNSVSYLVMGDMFQVLHLYLSWCIGLIKTLTFPNRKS